MINLANHKLLLDTIENFPDHLWAELEDRILEPLLITDRIIVITAGRFRNLPWSHVELRSRLVSVEKCEIKPFDLEAIRSRVEQSPFQAISNYVNLKQLQKYSVGNPWLLTLLLNKILSKFGSSHADCIELSTLNDAWKHILSVYRDDLLNHVPSALIIYIEASQPLRFYRTESLRYIMEKTEAYAPSATRDIRLLRALREMHRDVHIVWWSSAQRGYVTDPVARAILEQLRRLEDKSKYIAQHNIALNMYKERTNKYKETSIRFLIEICYHDACLNHHRDGKEILTEWDYVRSIAKAHLLLDDVLALQQELTSHDGDEELQRLLPDNLKGKIAAELEEIINTKTVEDEVTQ